MSFAQVHADLLYALASVDGLRVADSITPGTPPAKGIAVLKPSLVVFDQTMGRSSDTLTFDLGVFVSDASPRTFLADLEALITDVKAAIESDDVVTLTVAVTEAGQFGYETVTEASLYGCHLTVEVTAVA